MQNHRKYKIKNHKYFGKINNILYNNYKDIGNGSKKFKVINIGYNYSLNLVLKNR